MASSPPVPREVLQRQVTSSLDRAFQNLFTLVGEVVALYNQREAIDSTKVVHPRLLEVTPHVVEENARDYKSCFDTTGPDIHVDTVLELYAKARDYLHRGYLSNSWLTINKAAIYYGLSVEKADTKVIHLDCVHLMVTSLMSPYTQFRTQAAILNIKFANQLYSVFMACLRYAQVVEEATNVPGVTPEATIESDLLIMEGKQSEILSDLPKTERSSSTVGGGGGPPSTAAANPLEAMAAMFPGGMGDVMTSLMHTLPSITRKVTEGLSRATGTPVSESDLKMLDTGLNNITGMLRDPEGMKTLFTNLTRNPDGISQLVERLLTPPTSSSDGGGSSITAPPPPPPTRREPTDD